jgi:hypothetical protein
VLIFGEQHLRQILTNDLSQVLGVHTGRECCRTDKVREHHCDLATLGGVLWESAALLAAYLKGLEKPSMESKRGRAAARSGRTNFPSRRRTCSTWTSRRDLPRTQSLAARPPDNGRRLDSARGRPYGRVTSALRETRGVVVVRCLHCGHEGSLSRTAVVRFGLDPNAPIAAYVKRLR